ncbi:hypothetical protein [Shewanella xiamenensis]|nr:hypothetical protein [Shewanella xiamenensis]
MKYSLFKNGHTQKPRRSHALAFAVYAVGLIKLLLVELFKVSR